MSCTAFLIDECAWPPIAEDRMQVKSSNYSHLSAGSRHTRGGRPIMSWRSAWMWTNLDVKSFMAGMLAVGLLVMFQQNVGSKQFMHAVTYLDSRDQSRDYARLQSYSHNIASSVPNRSENDSDSAAPAITRNNIPDVQSTFMSTDVLINGSTVQEETVEEAAAYKGDHQKEYMVTQKRPFQAYGQALALFVHMGSYRGSPNSFAVIGLGAKPVHVYGNASFECEWVPAVGTNANESKIHKAVGSAPGSAAIKGKPVKYLPDWNMGRQYTVVVVNCSFEQAVGKDREGGELVVYALYGKGSGRVDMSPERFVAFQEKKGEYDAKKFREPYRYDFVYCGSPLYGNLNAQRIREWIAYHAKLFGKRAHFFLYDAGGISTSVERVLRPWKEKGFVSVQDIREGEEYDGYYYNQFLVLNDCLHRTRLLSPWTFFFDVDEYVYVPSHTTLPAVMQGFSNYTQIIFRQKNMAAHLCRTMDRHHISTSRMWGFEKLVYRNTKTGKVLDRKYAIQAKRALTAGVHRSDHIIGDNIVKESLGYFPESLVPDIWYYHFHNTITYNEELCTTFVEPLATSNRTSNSSSELISFVDTDGTPYCLDTGLQKLARSVKSFERKCIGHFDST